MTYYLKICYDTRSCVSSIGELEEDVEFVKKTIKELSDEYPVVYCHLDCHALNIVYDDNTSKHNYHNIIIIRYQEKICIHVNVMTPISMLSCIM